MCVVTKEWVGEYGYGRLNDRMGNAPSRRPESLFVVSMSEFGIAVRKIDIRGCYADDGKNMLNQATPSSDGTTLSLGDALFKPSDDGRPVPFDGGFAVAFTDEGEAYRYYIGRAFI